MSGSRDGIAARPAPSEPYVRVSRIRLKHPPALSRSTASAALGGVQRGQPVEMLVGRVLVAADR